jgi:TolA-binding protein
VPDAQFYLGEAYHQEGNAAGADSAYAAVVSGYPTSPRAPTALYKRALGMEEKGNVVGARGLLNELVQRYPRSDEAALAKERLRTLK